MRIGVIGCGYIAVRCHLPAIRRVSGLNLVAVCDPLPARRALAGSSVRQVADWQDIVNASDLDAILVASPSDTHAEIGVAALDAGKHLLLEKPVALTIDAADRLCDAERRSGRVAVVGFFLRHLTLFTELRRALSRIGSPLSATSAFHNHIARRQTVSGYERHRGTGGGVLFDLAYHHFDLCAWLFGSPPVAVDCRLDSRVTDDDVAQTLLTLVNGVRILGSFSSATYNENRIEIYGSDGRLMADMYRARRPRFRAVSEGNGGRFVRGTLDMIGALAISANILPAVKLQPFVTQLEAFRRAAHGEATTLPRMPQGRLALRAVLAAYESARTRREVSV